MLPPRQTSDMRLSSSPAPRPSRDSHLPVTPRSGVISRTPPMSDTTAWMVMTRMMPVAPAAKSNRERRAPPGRPMSGAQQQTEDRGLHAAILMKSRLLVTAGIVVIIIGGVFALQGFGI